MVAYKGGGGGSSFQECFNTFILGPYKSVLNMEVLGALGPFQDI